ncbi:hypothetical protein ACHHYP_12795 [Achlya hypogyna]|uniref:Uncharacterized protein n=1 Tax=Achlya hypogyna TaxID=1202772 RepID=A0A1V9YGK0_ACHHY|nr:hypothetical protein ACHHYP_12795 [Achlya hypogyna]
MYYFAPVQMPPDPVPSATSSALWGFPVYFSPETDQENDERQRRVARLKATLEQERARKTAQEHRAAEKQHAAQRLDHTKYLHYAYRYGSLPALLYCVSAFPGRVYELYVHRTAATLQAWAKARMVVLKTHARHHVAMMFVAAVLDAAVDKRARTVTQGDRANLLLRRIVLRAQVASFAAWKTWAAQTRAVKMRCRRAMSNTIADRFATWKQCVQTRALIRAGKLCQASVKVFRRCLFNRFQQWRRFAIRSMDIRRRFTAACGRRQRECLDRWSAFSTFARRTRRPLVRLQAWFRGCTCRRHFLLQKRAATVVECCWRGCLGRRHVRRLRESMRSLEIKLRFERRKLMTLKHEAFNAELHRAITAERDRHHLEMVALQAEHGRVQADVKKALAKILGNEYRAQLRDKTAAIKRLQGLDAKRAAAKATEEIIAEAVAVAVDSARSAFRATHPPPAACSTCLVGLPTASCPHDCADLEDARYVRYAEYAREQVLLQTVALAQLDKAPISYATLYKFQATGDPHAS